MGLKITKGDAYDASMTINELLNSPEVKIPQTAAYRLAKLYPKVRPFGIEVEKHMVKMAQQHGSEQFGGPDGTTSMGWSVSEKNREAYNTEVAVVRDEAIELDVTPVQVAAFGNTADGVALRHFAGLGDFVVGEPIEEVATV